MLQNFNKEIDFNKLKYFIVDVDGTLTDSGVIYDNHLNEFKRFSTRDFVGVLAAHYIGVRVIVITGRESAITSHRLEEMKIDEVYQGIKNKSEFLSNYMKKNKIDAIHIGYVGDDLNDYAAMQKVGFKACPNDSCEDIKEIADFTSSINGGYGVLQDVFRYILNQLGIWNNFIEEIIIKGF